MKNKSWRLIIDGPLTGKRNMAVDESILINCNKREQPTLRFYKWDPPCLSLGYFQKTGEIDLHACAEKGIDVVRRPTGGRAVLHKNELTYSVILPLSILPGKLLETYKIISSALTAGLQKLGIKARLTPARKQLPTSSAACFDVSSSYEINWEGKKLIGSAQTRRDSALLQHGSIPIFDYSQELISLLNLDSDRRQALKRVLTRKASSLTGAGLTWSEEEYLQGIQKLEKAFQAGFEQELGLDFWSGDLTPEEEKLACELEESKYGNLNWRPEKTPSSQ